MFNNKYGTLSANPVKGVLCRIYYRRPLSSHKVRVGFDLDRRWLVNKERPSTVGIEFRLDGPNVGFALCLVKENSPLDNYDQIFA